jgi:hypothetical protein
MRERKLRRRGSGFLSRSFPRRDGAEGPAWFTLKRIAKEIGTMTVTLELSPERKAALTTQARARGMSLEQWLLELTEQLAPPASIAHLQKTNPQEWARQFHAWAESHDRTTPLLSDEAISRDSIYPDRI